MIQQSARRPIRRVHRAEKSPRLRQQLPHSGRLHCCEIGTSVHRPEMRQIPVSIQLVRHHREPVDLHEIETSPAFYIARGQQEIEGTSNRSHRRFDPLQHLRHLRNVTHPSGFGETKFTMVQYPHCQGDCLQSFLEHCGVQLPRQQKILHRKRVRVVSTQISGHNTHELLEHQDQNVQFLIPILSMHENELVDDQLARCPSIVPSFGRTWKPWRRSKISTQVSQCFLLRLEAAGLLLLLKHDCDALRSKSVAGGTIHKSLKDVLVAQATQCLGDDHQRQKVLILV
mmetsp:Transcript_120274/g.275492  ORF Transcript_120274/g.275492 Transcript_120274/m.275492 type:complete len:285 (+) Transcript_120274:2278-3132(+)